MKAKPLTKGVYAGLITSIAPPRVKVTIRGALGISPVIEDWIVEFLDPEINRRFELIYHSGFPAGVRLFCTPHELVEGAKSRMRRVLVSEILADPKGADPKGA